MNNLPDDIAKIFKQGVDACKPVCRPYMVCISGGVCIHARVDVKQEIKRSNTRFNASKTGKIVNTGFLLPVCSRHDRYVILIKCYHRGVYIGC